MTHFNEKMNVRTQFLTGQLLSPPDTGGRQRTNHIWHALQACGVVETYTLRDQTRLSKETRDHYAAEFGTHSWLEPTKPGQRPPWKWLRPFNKTYIDRIAHNFHGAAMQLAVDSGVKKHIAQRKSKGEGHVSAIISRYLQPAAQAGVLGGTVPVIVDVDDLDTEVYRSRLNRPGLGGFERMLVKHHLKSLEHVVPSLLAAAAHLWVTSEEDLSLIDHSSVSVLPNIPAIDWSRMPNFTNSPDEPTILFIGSMRHRVNRDGLDRFLTHTWPFICQSIPDVRLEIVGSGMGEEQSRNWSKVRGVRVAGYVEDISSIYADSAITVVPLHEGGGTKIKVLESLAYGRLAVGTSHAFRGYKRLVEGDAACCVANSDRDLADSCIALLNNRERRDALARNLRELVEDRYSFDRFADIVGHDIERIMSSRRHHL